MILVAFAPIFLPSFVNAFLALAVIRPNLSPLRTFSYLLPFLFFHDTTSGRRTYVSDLWSPSLCGLDLHVHFFNHTTLPDSPLPFKMVFVLALPLTLPAFAPDGSLSRFPWPHFGHTPCHPPLNPLPIVCLGVSVHGPQETFSSPLLFPSQLAVMFFLYPHLLHPSHFVSHLPFL